MGPVRTGDVYKRVLYQRLSTKDPVRSLLGCLADLTWFCPAEQNKNKRSDEMR